MRNEKTPIGASQPGWGFLLGPTMGTVTLRPDGRWQITYEVASGVETTLATPATTRAEAERLLRHCEMQTWAIRATGVPLAPEPEPFSAIWEWWARSCLPRYSPHWRRTLQQQARDYLLPAIGHLHPGEIRPSIIAGLMRSLRDSGRLGDRGCNSVRSLAKIIIRDAIGDGRWPLGLPNPVEHVRQRQIQAKHWPTLTAADVARLIARTSGRRQCMWAIAAMLGLRKGELFALRRSDFDTRAKTVTVARSHDRQTTKTHRARTLPLTRALWAIVGPYLASLPAPDALLFPGRDGRILHRAHNLVRNLHADLVAAGIVGAWQARCRCGWRQIVAAAPAPKPKRSACPSCGRLYRVAGVAPQIRAHDLRHTFTTLAAEASVNPEVIRMTTGHSGDQASRYCHLSIRTHRDELEKIKIPIKQIKKVPVGLDLRRDQRSLVRTDRDQRLTFKERETGVEPATFSLEGSPNLVGKKNKKRNKKNQMKPRSDWTSAGTKDLLSQQTEALLHDCLSPTPEIALDAQDAIAALIRLAATEAGAPVVEIGGVA